MINMKEKENILMKMVTIMKGNFLVIKSMEKGYIIEMEKFYMKGILKMINFKVMENLFMKMENII